MANIVPPIVTGNTDIAVLDDIVARLDATTAFGAVLLGGSVDERERDRRPMAIVELLGWDQVSNADEEADIRIDRHVRFAVTVIARHDDPRQRLLDLNQLDQVVGNAINGQPLAGLVDEDFTMIRVGTYKRPEHPDQTLYITGEAQYHVEGRDQFDITTYQ